MPRPLAPPLASALVLALAGCAVGPDFASPALRAPDAWATGGAGGSDPHLARAVWWTRFGDPQLTSLVERGARANLALREADARVREAPALRRASFAGLWPTLDLGAATVSEAGGASVPRDGVFAALDAAWQLDVFGGVRRSVEAADADLAAEVEDRQALALLLVGEVARSYIELRGFEAQLDALERNLAAQREIAGLTEAQLRVGLASDLDVERARALVAVTAAQLPPLDAIAAELLPPGIRTTLAGQSQDFADAGSSLLFAFGLALALIYLLLAAQFESFRDPFVILTTVPLSVCGALVGLLLFGQTLNVFSQIGLILLIGLVTKNGILIVDFANQRVRAGLAPHQAALEAAAARLRPILMTTGATLFGMLPIALSLGGAAGSRQSLGVATVTGLFFSTALTLYVVPAAWLALARRREPREAHAAGAAPAVIRSTP